MLSHAFSGRSWVISCHLHDIGRYLVTIGYNCYRGNNHVLMNKRRPNEIVIEKQQGMEVLVPIYPRLCQLRTNSLYVLISY